MASTQRRHIAGRDKFFGFGLRLVMLEKDLAIVIEITVPMTINSRPFAIGAVYDDVASRSHLPSLHLGLIALNGSKIHGPRARSIALGPVIITNCYNPG